MKLLIQWTLLVVSGVLIGGCAVPSGSAPTEPNPIAPPNETRTAAKPMPLVPSPAPTTLVAPLEPSANEKNLAIALTSFDRGEYSLAMKQLKPLTTDQALDKPDRLKAIKSLAFAQCLTRAVLACRKTFETAFQLNPDFDLAPAEQGHPVWGPQFLRARQTMKSR